MTQITIIFIEPYPANSLQMSPRLFLDPPLPPLLEPQQQHPPKQRQGYRDGNPKRNTNGDVTGLDHVSKFVEFSPVILSQMLTWQRRIMQVDSLSHSC